MQDNEKQLRTEYLALEVLTFSRDSLLVNLRFLDAALSRLPFTPYKGSYATDGHKLYFDPRYVLRTYQAEQTLPARSILHIVFHCVFGHVFIPEDAQDLHRKRIWDLSCDIAAEHTISALSLQAAACRDQNRMDRVFSMLLEKIDMLTAEKLYRYFLKAGYDEDTISEYETLFHCDDHSLRSAVDESLRATWQEVAHRMQIDMETFTRQQKDSAGALMQNLKETNRIVSDYAGFLRKFATRTDGMKLDPDEFDYSLYSYGMQLSNGRVPLMEQIEYRDPQRVRDIAIAIYAHDILTQEKVRLFLLNTWDILHSTESFYSKVRLHVLLPSKSDIPDENGAYAKVLATIEDKIVTSTEEMHQFVSGLTIPDAHANDFRPLFDKVADLSRKHAFKSLRGLLVLTEDVGAFPPDMPSYPGAFIFVNNDYSVPEVPPWAIRLVLQGDDL